MTESGWWWLSFSGDDGWLGGCAVRAESFMHAVDIAWTRRINPGGEVKGMFLAAVDDEPDLEPVVPYRLYSKAELLELGPITNMGP